MVGNDLVNDLDILGQQSGREGWNPPRIRPDTPFNPNTTGVWQAVSGPDVTGSVQALLSRAERDFWTKFSEKERCMKCARLSSFDLTKLVASWEIPNLRPGNLLPAGSGETTHGLQGHFTAVFMGRVWLSSSINYAIYGKMWKICADYHAIKGYRRLTESELLTRVRTHKGLQQVGFYEHSFEIPWIDVLGMQSFARYGFSGRAPSSITPEVRNGLRLVLPSSFVNTMPLEWSWPN